MLGLSLVAALLALLLASCATVTPRPWIATGGDPAAQTQALALVAAAQRALPDPMGALFAGGEVRLLPSLDGQPTCCVVPAGYHHLGGCACQVDQHPLVWIEWPFHTGTADLALGPLPHELSHFGLEYLSPGLPWSPPSRIPSEAECDAGGLLVVQEYRRNP